ncbi:response regulator transcription factor [Jonesia denitrificans]|uniref:Two component transcriptional regulator, LuxR family n=1 Tax=Jonesia denitrificans (strain ATCC 14870 / DSM 20603 / BCRC 15368 / CIP 55.134 / JCM 11481 / NBRC 15587 / NCTC 10816 / Prevot 55134) TaxID=471856 RepID=C7R5B5_JONDD|nr:response regulator transcription factor [Jonesia denitrificans]ACV07793.1 two component transcriptional regulator, LuxR family [Jonesia denitrificans DSM 20603]ASE08489.1 DNA-binding response regulator [Jonesia denitrificans]QXB43097.1 response regulator transcription factor [Jonesia denitrificans]SQH19766.1 Response regulator protein vraR [Jonesia denitrificans]
MTIRVLIADDQALVRSGLAALLDLEPDIEVVAEVSTGAQAISVIPSTRPHVCLMDVQMPDLNGIEATQSITCDHPGVAVIMVTTFGRTGYLKDALAAGARGFIVKDTPASQLAETIRAVHRGIRVVDPELAASSLAEGSNPLTDREQDALRCALTGDTVAGIAARLHVSAGSARNLLSQGIQKTGAANRVQAARIASERGWIPPL